MDSILPYLQTFRPGAMARTGTVSRYKTGPRGSSHTVYRF